MKLSQMTKRVHAKRGSSLVEFALVMPILLLLFAAIVDFAFLFQRYQVLSNATREGARLAVLPANFSISAVIAPRIREYVRLGVGLPAVNEEMVPVTLATQTVAVPGAGQYTLVTVRAELVYNYLVIGHVAHLIQPEGTPWGAIRLRAESTMRVEGL